MNEFNPPTETIYGQVIAKSNHYMVGKNGGIIKDDRIRRYEKSFSEQCSIYKGKAISSRFKLLIRVYHSSLRFDLDNSLKTVLDCLQTVGAITDDKFCFKIEAEKRIDKRNPRVEFSVVEIDKQQSLF